MKKYTKKRKTINWNMLTHLVCDVCGKKYKINNEHYEYYNDNEESALEDHEFINIKFTGGFGSVFGDMDTYECDICQYCLKKKLGKFLRKVD